VREKMRRTYKVTVHPPPRLPALNMTVHSYAESEDEVVRQMLTTIHAGMPEGWHVQVVQVEEVERTMFPDEP
jgi:hypothetical protein